MKAPFDWLAPSATSMIRMDHSKVMTVFHRFKAETGPETKRAIVGTICALLEIHAQLEEEIFYPAMRDVDPSSVEKNVPEHDRMRQLIGALRNMEPTNVGYDRAVMDLMREVIHHVADEETVLLPKAEHVLSHRLGELGMEMAKRKMQLMLPRSAELATNAARATPAGSMLLGAGVVLAASLLFGRSRHSSAASSRYWYHR